MEDFPENDAPSPPVLTAAQPASSIPLASTGVTIDQRPASPVWDLELDLNPSDEEMDAEPARKRPRNGSDIAEED